MAVKEQRILFYFCDSKAAFPSNRQLDQSTEQATTTMVSRSPNGSNGSDGKPLLPSDLIFRPDGKHLNLSGWLLRNSCWETLRSLSLLFPKIPRRPRITSITWSSLNHVATLAGDVTWTTLAPELRYARRHLPPSVQMMVAFLRTRSLFPLEF